MKHAPSAYFAVVAALIAVFVGAGSAHANFPGNNGLIAFDSWTGTSQDIGVFDPNRPDSMRLLTSTPDFHEQTPRWSPDGTKIVYMGHPQYEGPRTVTDIWVMDAQGEHRTQLTNTPRREEVPAWTADGRIVYCGQSGDAGGWEIYLMNADGSDVRRLTNSVGLDCWPSPAPHGDKIAFTSDRNGVLEIFTIHLNGTEPRRVTTGYMSDWSPSGNALVFGRDAPNDAGVPDGDIDVWSAHANGSGLARLTATPGRIEWFPSWSPNGAEVVYGGVVQSGVINIFALNVADRSERLLLADAPPTTYSVAYPAWQPLDKG